jgi:hypothetical protein
MENLSKQLVVGWISRREKIKEIEAECKARIGPLKEEMVQIEVALMKLMEKEGIKSMKTEVGTAYLSEMKTVSVADWPVVLEHIQEKERWDLLERRVPKSAALEYGDVPGLRIETFKKLNVRRV